MTTELNDLEALLEKVLPDPMGFAERVVQQVLDRLATDVPAGQPVVVPSYDSRAHEALADQNVMLAAALGACDCWGNDPDCRTCAGAGSAGWMPPDRGLYAELVEPASARVSAGGDAERREEPVQQMEGEPL